jgi:hypothetical protein
MRKLINLSLALVFVANYALSAIAVSYFLNWYDTGQWNSDGWMFMGIGGLVCGCLALWIETKLYAKHTFWPTRLLPFLCRLILMGMLWIAISFALGNYLALLTTSKQSAPQLPVRLLAVFVIRLMTVFYSFLIAPFGVIVGLVNGVLVRLTCAFH